MSTLHQDRRAAIEATPVISNGAAYAIGDAVGGLMTFNAAAKQKGGGGFITGVGLTIKQAAIAPSIDFLIFQELVTTGVDNAAFAPSDAELAKLAGPAKLVATDYAGALSANRPAFQELSIPYICTAGSTSLYVQLVARTVVTFGAVDELVAHLALLRD